MKIKLPALVLLALTAAGQVRAAMLTGAEASFLDQLATAAAVLEQRCAGYEINGAGSVQLGTRLLGSTTAAMAMIDAYSAAIKAHDGATYDPRKFRSEVFEAASRTSKRIRSELIKNPAAACAGYGESSVERGLLRRY
jgi:hypothetical protein